MVIPNLVTSMGGAFWNNQLTSVMIPDSVTKIEPSAFAYNKLTSVTLPKALYDKRSTAFDSNPAGLKFYEYDASKAGNKGNYLGGY